MKTQKNLTTAYIGESMARNKYDMYAKTAMTEGFEQIAAVFTETADQEREHAKQVYNMLNQLQPGAIIEVEATAHILFGTTAQNLQTAIDGETYEYTRMYPDFAAEAQKEGYPDIAARLRAIARAEDHHEKRYTALLSNLKDSSVYKKKKETDWVCRKCGYQHSGKTPPEKCPACSHPTAYFQVKSEVY